MKGHRILKIPPSCPLLLFYLSRQHSSNMYLFSQDHNNLLLHFPYIKLKLKLMNLHQLIFTILQSESYQPIYQFRLIFRVYLQPWFKIALCLLVHRFSMLLRFSYFPLLIAGTILIFPSKTQLMLDKCSSQQLLLIELFLQSILHDQYPLSSLSQLSRLKILLKVNFLTPWFRENLYTWN